MTYASFAPAPHRFNIFRKIFISVINSDLFARFDITRGVNHDATVFDLGLDIGLARMIDIAGKVVRDLPVDCPFSIYFKKNQQAFRRNNLMAFAEKVIWAVRKIPRGRTISRCF